MRFPFNQTSIAILSLVTVANIHAANLVPAPVESDKLSQASIHLKVPGSNQPAGIKVWLSGGGTTLGLSEHSVTGSDGRATLFTARKTYSYVVARRTDCDITIGGTRANLSLAGENFQFSRGRLNLLSPGSQASPDFFFNHDGQQAAGPLEMRKKTAGKARFSFLAEDSELLRHTLADDHSPVPGGKIFVTGDWNNFNQATEDTDPENGAKELFDDGGLIHEGDGDGQIRDAVFTRVLDLPPGVHTYCFIVNGLRFPDLWLRDPYEEGHKDIQVTREWSHWPGTPVSTYSLKLKASTITVTR